MDALKKLKAEIERKKRQLQDTDIMAPDKKYFKRGDLAARETEEYLRKHFPQEAEAIRENGEDKSKKAAGKDRGDEEERNQQPRKEGVGENDFKAAMDAVDQQYLNDIISSNDNQSEASSADVSVKDDGTTEEDVPKMRDELGKGDSHRDQEIILRFFKFIMKKWGDQLNARSPEERRTTRGKMSSAIHTQTVSYLKPLFRQLKNKKMEQGLLENFVEIVQHVMDRHYIKANDSYLEMAIGNAPWPIGVTMVGIHARTGREKISSRYVAHVLNDETQRKYIQAVKRLMTQCQKLFPTQPSRSFNYQCPV